MKPNLLIFFFLLFSLYGFSQTKKIYLDAKGAFIESPKKAVNYILLNKINDTSYLLRQFDMHDTITMQGTYKDSLLKVPNGKFVYYKKNVVDARIRDIVHADENNYVQKVGYFENGEKSGMWVDFQKRNVKNQSCIYQHGKLNGPVLYYHLNNDKIIDAEGNYFDDLKEGEWKTYGFDSVKTPSISDIFSHGTLQKHIEHYKESDFSGGLMVYLKDNCNKAMEKAGCKSLNFNFNG